MEIDSNSRFLHGAGISPGKEMFHPAPRIIVRLAKARRTDQRKTPSSPVTEILQLPTEILSHILVYAWSWPQRLQLLLTCRMFHDVAATPAFLRSVGLPDGGFPSYHYMCLVAEAGMKVSVEMFEDTLKKFMYFRPSMERVLERRAIDVPPVIDNPTKEWVHAYLICHNEIDSAHGRRSILGGSTLAELQIPQVRMTLATRILTTTSFAWAWGKSAIRLPLASSLVELDKAVADQLIQRLIEYITETFSVSFMAPGLIRDEVVGYLPLIWDKVRDVVIPGVGYIPSCKFLYAVLQKILEGPVVESEDFIRALARAWGTEMGDIYPAFKVWAAGNEKMEELLTHHALLSLDGNKTYQKEEFLLARGGTLDLTEALIHSRDPANILWFAYYSWGRSVKITYSADKVISDLSDNHGKHPQSRAIIARIVCIMLDDEEEQLNLWTPLFQAFLLEILQNHMQYCPSVAAAGNMHVPEILFYQVVGRMMPLVRPPPWQKILDVMRGRCGHCITWIRGLYDEGLKRLQ